MKEVEIGRTHIKEGEHKHHQIGTKMESSGEKKEGSAQTNLETFTAPWDGNYSLDLGGDEKEDEG